MSHTAVNRRLRATKSVHRMRSRSGNVILLPANELAALAKWKKRAAQLPPGEILLVIPHRHSGMQELGQRLRRNLALIGQSCTLVRSG